MVIRSVCSFAGLGAGRECRARLETQSQQVVRAISYGGRRTNRSKDKTAYPVDGYVDRHHDLLRGFGEAGTREGRPAASQAERDVVGGLVERRLRAVVEIEVRIIRVVVLFVVAIAFGFAHQGAGVFSSHVGAGY